MSIEIVRIFRAMSDHGGRRSLKNRAFYYNEIDEVYAVSWTPNTDIIESEDQVEIRMELAGVRRDQVAIFLNDGKLVVQGARLEEKMAEPVYYHQVELSYGRFAKVISLPESIEHNEIYATLQDGLLQIKISKKSKIIEIPVIGEAGEKKK